MDGDILFRYIQHIIKSHRRSAIKVQHLAKQFGERIRSTRTTKRFTQAELGRRIGKSKQLVSAWEGGRSEMTLTSLARLAVSLDVDLNWLVLGKACPRITADPAENTIIPLIEPKHDLNGVQGIQDLRMLGAYICKPAQLANSCIAILARDHGMRPTIKTGDLVYVDPNAAIEPGTVVAALVRKLNDVPLKSSLLMLRVYRPSASSGTLAPYDLIASTSVFRPIAIVSDDDAILIGPVVGSVSV